MFYRTSSIVIKLVFSNGFHRIIYSMLILDLYVDPRPVILELMLSSDSDLN